MLCMVNPAIRTPGVEDEMVNKSAFVFTSLALCMAALAQGPARDSNVVGWQRIETHKGYNFLAPNFVKFLGDQTWSLDNIRGKFTDGDSITFLDSTNTVVATFKWLTGQSFGLDNFPHGWYHEEGDYAPADFECRAGTATLFYFQHPAHLFFIGEVAEGDLQVQLPAGQTYAGTARPFPVMFQSLSWAGIPSLSTLIWMNEEGNVAQQRRWSGGGWQALDTSSEWPYGVGLRVNVRMGQGTVTVPGPDPAWL